MFLCLEVFDAGVARDFWETGDGRLTNFWNDVWLRQVDPIRSIVEDWNKWMIHYGCVI